MEKDQFEKIVGAPAQALEAMVEGAEKLEKELQHVTPVRKLESFWKKLGPGLITGAADDDPSGIATYSQTGAQYGYQLSWLALFTYPFMATVQEMCARIGVVTGKGLAANIRTHFPRWVLYLTAGLLFAANVFNIGVDFGAMAKATQLIIPNVSFSVLVVLFAVITVNLEIFLPYKKYAKVLKWATFALFSYIITAFIVDLNWHEIAFQTLVPNVSFEKEQWYLIAAFMGTTISPYLFFWQSSQEVEEGILHHTHPDHIHNEVKDMRKDVWLGMFLSNLVAFFIVVVCAATLHRGGITNISTAAEAAAALKPLAGQYAYLLFTIGIIGTGFLAIPVLAGSAAYAISETFKWREGLHYKLKQATSFYGIMIIAVLLGLLLNFVGLDPIRALIYSAVFNAIISPICVILIVLISSNEKIMGEWKSGPFVRRMGWASVALVTVAAFFGLLSLI